MGGLFGGVGHHQERSNHDDPAGNNRGNVAAENSHLSAFGYAVLDEDDRQHHRGKRERDIFASERQPECVRNYPDGYTGYEWS